MTHFKCVGQTIYTIDFRSIVILLFATVIVVVVGKKKMLLMLGQEIKKNTQKAKSLKTEKNRKGEKEKKPGYQTICIELRK